MSTRIILSKAVQSWKKLPIGLVMYMRNVAFYISLLISYCSYFYCYSPEGEYWKYSMGQKTALHAFGWKWTDLDKIWNFVSYTLGAWPFSLRGSRNFVFSHANKARFHRFLVGQILRHLEATTLIGEAVKTSGTEFWKFCHKESIFQKKCKNCSTKFPGLVTSGCHNSAVITDRLKFTSKWSLCRMSSFHFYLPERFRANIGNTLWERSSRVQL